MNILKDFENEINSLHKDALFFEGDYVVDDVYKKIDDFRTKEIKGSVALVVSLISNVLSDIYPDRRLVSFQSKQGLKSWVESALKDFTASEIYQALAVLRENRNSSFERSWSINRNR
jgi:hypothetical protein